MTSRQIRDIAAYIGCDYSVEVFDRNVSKEDWPEEWQTKSGSGITLLVRLSELLISDDSGKGPFIRNLKLHLRKIASLSDEEVRACARLAYLALGHDEPTEVLEVHVHSAFFLCGLLDIDFNTKEDYVTFSYNDNHALPTGGIIAYLQSIGVYVPNTIDKQFVSLID